MVSRFFTIMLFLCHSEFSLFAQLDSINSNARTSPKFNFGVFKSFSDFKLNKPTFTSGFNIKVDSGSSFVRYLLFDDQDKKIRSVYGFSDGEALFINAKVYGQSTYFVPILMWGEILYFEDEVGKTNALAARSGLLAFGLVGGISSYLVAAPEAVRNPGWIIYLPDDDGNAYALSRQTIKSILKTNNSKLLAQFEDEPDKNSYQVLIKYLNLYNEEVASKDNGK
jgi:hypothetical protein